MHHLPPLNSLKVFHAVSQAASLSAAAKKLTVTHGAVSRQIQLLEEHLGVKLLQRLPRGVSLTAEGKILAFATQRAFATLSECVADLREAPESSVVTLSTVASLAARWLAPRLNDFYGAHPDIDLRISTTPHLVDFMRDGVDIAIRFGLGKWQGLAAEPLCPPRLITVAAPGREHDPATARLIGSDGTRHWEEWFAQNGRSKPQRKNFLIFEDANVVIEAALAGQGLALIPEILVLGELRSGQLVQPFPEAVHSALGYSIVIPDNRNLTDSTQKVREWLRAQAAVTWR